MTQADDRAVDEGAAAEQAWGGDVVAGPDPGYRWKHLIMSVLVIAGGCWFAYDGWVKWPYQNQMADKVTRDLEAAQREKNQAEIDRLALELKRYEKHNDASILIQKVLAFTLPAFGIFWGAWTLRETRGQLRLSGDTLEVPGHPPIAFGDVRAIDKRKWDRKGIAYIHYEHGSPPRPGVLKLDDFAYERKPTDQMLERIERSVVPANAGEAGSTTA